MQDAVSTQLREAAIAADLSARETMPLAEVWRALREGTARVVDPFFSSARCYLVLDANIPPERRLPLSSRRRQLLESLLGGEYPKALAARLDVGTSTISTLGKLALQQIGVDCTLAHFHPLLAMAACADRDGNQRASGRLAEFVHRDRGFRVIGIARPDDGLEGMLPPAEFAVVRGLVEGKNYLEIARGRGTSTRTVANQLGTAFRRLGVSGRTGLLSRLATEHALHP